MERQEISRIGLPHKPAKSVSNQRFTDKQSGTSDPQSALSAGSSLASRASSMRLAAMDLLNTIDSPDHTHPSDLNSEFKLPDEVRRFETELIRAALDLTGGHQGRAAKLLGLKSSTLFEKISRYRIMVVKWRKQPTEK